MMPSQPDTLSGEDTVVKSPSHMTNSIFSPSLCLKLCAYSASSRQLPLSLYALLTQTTTQYAFSIAAAIALSVEPLIAGAYLDPSSSLQTSRPAALRPFVSSSTNPFCAQQ
eukprot:CAMPEP_0114146394 /NCGR_PEP_ID=MMETSP0043_2-20121206/20544_1 /TAXON_ID=464988 /ORGANISM="Hemiselmis andersenii, Strain CCMP644" /LENGTH=110 /DNA_ID=CAMNT_0001240851 /DNA_START=83 /DNA_END=415 /DNA_ORIENTATION=-